MEAQVKWLGDLTFVGHGDSAHGLVIDAGKGAGGLGIGASPMELLLLGTGGCASIDVVMILQKARQKITDCVVHLSAERAETPPRKFTSIHMHFVVTGRGLGDRHVARAIELSITKYCSASATLAGVVELTHGYEIIEAE